MRAWLALFAAGCLLGPAHAHGQEPPVARLTFERAAGADRCVDEEALRERVAARLGRDPFVDEAPLAIDVRVAAAEEGTQGGFVAMIALTDARDARETHREITSTRPDCADLGDALALAVSLAVDPASLLRPAGAATTEPTEAPAADASPTPEPATPTESAAPAVAQPAAEAPVARDFHEEPRSPLSARIGAMLLGSYGVAPNLSAGLALSAGARFRDVSLDVELRAEVPTEVAGDNGTVRGAPFTAALVPCGHVDVVALCGVLRAGAFYGEGVDAVESKSALSAYTAVGLRGGAEIPVTPSVDLRVIGEASTPITSVELRLGPEVVWETPPVGLSIGVGLGGRLR